MRTKALLALGAIALSTTFVYAEPLAKASIPFAFNAGGKALPAGDYEFTSQELGKMVVVRNVSTGAATFAMVQTRLAAGIHATPKDAHVVFDKVGDAHTLSEIWVPGGDGYAFNIIKGEHAHKVLDVPVK